MTNKAIKGVYNEFPTNKNEIKVFELCHLNRHTLAKWTFTKLFRSWKEKMWTQVNQLLASRKTFTKRKFKYKQQLFKI